MQSEQALDCHLYPLRRSALSLDVPYQVVYINVSKGICAKCGAYAL